MVCQAQNLKYVMHNFKIVIQNYGIIIIFFCQNWASIDVYVVWNAEHLAINCKVSEFIFAAYR